MKQLFLSGLNPDQFRAVTFGNGPLLILAGAGSGKTRCLTYRVAWLMAEKLVNPDKILLLTFTNKAAGEMKNRVKTILSALQPLSLGPYPFLPWSGTFHSWCAFVLRRWSARAGLKPEWIIYDEDDRRQLIRDIISDLKIDSKKYKLNTLAAVISEAKNEMVTPLQYLEMSQGDWQETVGRIFIEYQRRLIKFSGLDFDDLLFETVKLFDSDRDLLARFQEKIQHLLIDEYQDTNSVQYKLTRQLSGRHRNITVVGDMAQSIYTFRGANFRNLLNFKKDYPDLTEIRLERNYRSNQPILDAAHNLIRNNATHPVLKLWTEKTSGKKPGVYAAVSELEESRFIIGKIEEAGLSADGEFKFSDFAVLYRTNAQSRVFEESLLTAGIPYVLVGGIRFYERAEIKDCLSYLRLIYNPADKISETRTLKLGKQRYVNFRRFAAAIKPKQSETEVKFVKTTRELLDGIIAATKLLERFGPEDPEDLVRIENVKELLSVAEAYPDLGQFLEQVALIEDQQLKRRTNTADAVTLMTLHAAKGLEFPTVFLAGLEEGLLPHSRSLFKPEDLEEERRLMYVGVTRAMENLYLTYARSRMYFGSRGVSVPSRFISEIGEEAIDRLS